MVFNLVATATLSILSPEIILRGPKDLVVCVGCEMRQTCRIASPPLESGRISWKKDNNEIALPDQENRVYSILSSSEDTNTNELIIRNITWKDSGEILVIVT